MDITLVDFNNVMRPQARGGLPTSYTIGEVRITANNLEEIRAMMVAMQAWANGTFEPVVMERPEPDASLVVSPVQVDLDEGDEEYINPFGIE